MGGDRDKARGQPVHHEDIVDRFGFFLLGFSWLGDETDAVTDREGFNGYGLEVVEYFQ